MEEKKGRRKLRRGVLLPIIAFVLVVAASAVAVRLILGPGARQANGTASGTGSRDASSQVTSGVDSYYVDSTAATDQSSETDSSQSDSSQADASETSSAASEAVSVQLGDTSYFSDAVFIGDSLTSGIKDYNIMKTKGVLATNAMTTRSALVSKLSVNSESLAVPDAVKALQPAKVYVLLGANEIRGVTGTSGFITNYGALVDQLKQAAPKAKIYIQSMLPVTADYEDQYGVTNDTIDAFNTAIETMCTSKGVTFVDAGSALKGSDGKLAAEDASSGYNIRKSAYSKWINYLAAHK